MPKLNIWWFSQYASTPDQQFTAQYDLARRLVEKGHCVTFFAAGFSHYKFQEVRLRPGETFRVDRYDGVRFVWLKTPAYRVNNWKRIANMLSFAWRAYWIARRRGERPDIIIGTTFHPFSALAAYAISIVKGRPFVLDVGDLWPLTVIQFGKLSRTSTIAIALGALEKFLARKATRIMTNLSGGADYYSRLGVPRERVVWIPNGLELSRYADIKPYTGAIPKNFTLVYAGGHVEAFPLGMVLRAAKIEQENGGRARFLFVGGGQEKPRLVALALKLDLRNVEFRDAVPKNELYRVLEQADAFVLSMRDLPDLYQYGISFNKLCDYVASGRPVLFAGNPNYNVVKEFGCGIVVPPEDPQSFAEAVRIFENLTVEERMAMGRNGLRCAKERFDIEMLAGRLEELLLSVAEESGSSRDHKQYGRNAATPRVPSGQAGPLSQEN